MKCVTAAFVIAAFLSGVATAEADPASTANQATILRFANKVKFGVIQRANIQAQVDSALEHFLSIRNRSANLTNFQVNHKNTMRVVEYMNISKIALAGVLLSLASPLAAEAQSASQNSSQIENAALANLSYNDRMQVQNVLGLLSVGQIDANTAVLQIDAVLSDSEAQSVLSEAKKANSDANDAGQFLVDLAHPTSK